MEATGDSVSSIDMATITILLAYAFYNTSLDLL